MLRAVRLRMENYKSVEQADIPLDSRVTVLVGRNNSGKSNLIDCLGFLHVLTSGSSEQAIAERGGFERIVYGGDSKRTIRLNVEFDGANHASLIRRLDRLGVPTENLKRLGDQGTWVIRYEVRLNGTWFEEAMELQWGSSRFPMAK